MTRDQMLADYGALKAARRRGEISDADYAAKRAALTFTDDEGRTYGVDPQSDRLEERDGVNGATGVFPSEAGSADLPKRPLALIRLIASKTLASFLRRLPITILIGVVGALLHTYLLVVVNNGYLKSGVVGGLLMIRGNILSGTIIWLVGPTLLMGLVGRLFSRGKPKVTLRDRVRAIIAYVQEQKKDVYAVVGATVGLSLVVGALVNGAANLTLALGVGALIASRSGSVIALLARTAWNTAFTLYRSQTMKRHGMAIGYVAMLASAIGFLANSILTPAGAGIGVLLLGGALAYAFTAGSRTQTTNTLLFLGLSAALLATLAGTPELVLAHDGGWQEYMGNRPLTPANILEYLQRGGSLTALLHGLPAGAAAALGAALASALNGLGQGFDGEFDDGSGPRENTRIRDGDAARDWMIRNGYYDADGNPTQKFHDWMNAPHSAGTGNGLRGFSTDPDGNIVIVTADDPPAGGDGSNGTGQGADDHTDGDQSSGSGMDAGGPDQTAQGQSRQDTGGRDTSDDGGSRYSDPEWSLRNQPRNDGDGYSDPEWSMRNNPDPANMDWDPNTNSWRQKDDIYADRMTREGYNWDDDSQTWVRGWRRGDDDAGEPEWVPDETAPPSPRGPRTPLNEYYQRGDYLEDKRFNLTQGQRDALDRILASMGYRGHGVDPENISPDDLDTLRRLTHATNDFLAGQSESAGAQAQHEAIDAQHRENVAIKIVDTGKKAAAILESKVTPWTRGAISSFVYDTIQNRDRGTGEALRDAATNATFQWVGGHLGAQRQGDVAWNALTSGLTDAARTGYQGGNAEDMARSGLSGAATGALFEHLQNVEQRNGGSLFGGGGDADLPSIDAGDDPTLQAGSRGLGSDDTIPGQRPTLADDRGDAGAGSLAGPTADEGPSTRGTPLSETADQQGSRQAAGAGGSGGGDGDGDGGVPPVGGGPRTNVDEDSSGATRTGVGEESGPRIGDEGEPGRSPTEAEAGTRTPETSQPDEDGGAPHSQSQDESDGGPQPAQSTDDEGATRGSGADEGDGQSQPRDRAEQEGTGDGDQDGQRPTDPPETTEDIRNRSRQAVRNLDAEINRLRDVPPDDPGYAAARDRLDMLEGARRDRKLDILRANNTDVQKIDEELSRHGDAPGVQAESPAEGTELDTKVRNLGVRRNELMQEIKQIKSDHVAPQVNRPAEPDELLPGGLPRERADFDVQAPGSASDLPRSREAIRRAVRAHVDNKSKDTPFESWTAIRRVAVADGTKGFPGDQLAVAHIPEADFQRMVNSGEVVLPKDVSANTLRPDNLREQETLIHRVDRRHWRVETPEVREAIGKGDDLPLVNGMPTYTDPEGKKFVVLYRSMRKDQFPSGTDFL
jgi:hypothetical protein